MDRAHARPRGRRTQAERSAESERRILAAARELIARQGYTRTTLAEIGRRAGYTGGLVSHRFGSKEGLLRALVGRIAARFYADQLGPAVASRSGLDAISAGMDAYLDELLLRQDRIRALYVSMGEALGPVPAVREIFAALNRGFRASLRGWIEAGIADGEIRAGLDPETEAAVVLALLRGIALQWLTDPGCLDLEAVRKSLRETVRGRLAAGPA